MASSKRRNRDGADFKSVKKNKTKEYWRNQERARQHAGHGIGEGEAGVFVTCDRGREAKCVEEMYGLLEKAVEEVYGEGIQKRGAGGEGAGDGDGDGDGGEEEEDIEAAIRKEITELKEAKSEKPFVSVKLEVECVVFFRLNPLYDPTALVAALCAAARRGDGLRSRYVHRLTPVTRTGKATAEGLEGVAKVVLPPHFHDGQDCVKFAIRPTTRNHNKLRRDQVIKIVADVVGPKHKADLKNYDVLILVEIYQGICGMSVVKDWEDLKKFNLAQLQGDKEEEEEVVVVVGEVGTSKAEADQKAEKESV